MQVSFCRRIVEPGTLGDDWDLVLDLLQPAAKPIAVIRLAPETFAEVAALCRQLEAEARDRGPGFRSLQRLRLVQLLLLLSRCRGRTGAQAAARPGPSTMEEVVRFIREHSGEDLSLVQLAARFRLNASYLSRAFARHTGIHLVEYVNRVRIEKGCMLLKRSGMSILEIALWVGYNNISYFNRCFRRITGMSPREYRARRER